MIKAKTLFLDLAYVGERMSELFFTHYVLKGLGPRYFSFVSNMNMREVQPSINILQSF